MVRNHGIIADSADFMGLFSACFADFVELFYMYLIVSGMRFLLEPPLFWGGFFSKPKQVKRPLQEAAEPSQLAVFGGGEGATLRV